MGNKPFENCPVCGGELYAAYPDPTSTSCKKCGECFTVERKYYKRGGFWKSIDADKWEWVDAQILRIRKRQSEVPNA